MNRFHRIGLLSLVLGSCVAAGCSGESSPESDEADPTVAPASLSSQSTMPVYRVVSSGVDEARASMLVAALGLDHNALGPRVRTAGGALRYMNADRFQRVPMKDAPSRIPAAKDEDGH